MTIYVALPPPGRHHNLDPATRSRSSADGYHGLLLSSSTHIPRPGLDRGRGADRALARARPEADPDLARRPRRPGRARGDEHAAECGALRPQAEHARPDRPRLRLRGARLAASLTVLRPGELLAIPAMVLGSTIASALHVEHGIPWWSGVIALGLTCHSPSWPELRRLFALALVAVLGRLRRFPRRRARRPSRSPRSARIRKAAGLLRMTNQVETLLLAPALALGPWSSYPCFAVVALASLVVVGWSRLGADGGGLTRLRGWVRHAGACLPFRGRVTAQPRRARARWAWSRWGSRSSGSMP